MKVRFIATVMASVFLTSLVQAAEIKLLASAALKDAYLELIPQFESATGHKVTAAWSSTPDVQKRIAAGEVADLVILSAAGTDELIKQGKVDPSSRVDFAKAAGRFRENARARLCARRPLRSECRQSLGLTTRADGSRTLATRQPAKSRIRIPARSLVCRVGRGTAEVSGGRYRA